MKNRKKMKYNELKSLEDIGMAQREVQAKLRSKGRELNRRLDTVKDSLTPVSLLASGLRGVSKKLPVDYILLPLVRKAISRLK